MKSHATTTPRSRLLRALARPLLALACLSPLAAEELLLNGGFEAGPPPLRAKPEGWNRVIDNRYWVITTNLPSAPEGSTAGPVFEGNFALRRILYGSQPPAELLAQTPVYPRSIQPGETLQFSLSARPVGPSGGFEVFGAIQFLDSTGNPLGDRRETKRIISDQSAWWDTLRLTVVVPPDAVSFQVFAVVHVTRPLSTYGSANFDSVSLLRAGPPR